MGHQMKDGIQSTFANTTAQAWFTCSNFPIYTHSVDQLSRMDFSGVEYNDGSAYAVTCAYEYPPYLPTVAVADEAKQALLEYFDTTITTDDSFWTTFNAYLNSLTTAETEAVVDLYIRTFVPEGDLSTQNAPIDPTFWVMHAEVLRLYHAGIINGLLTDTSFTDASVDIQGHNAGNYQQWLGGLYLADGTNAVDFNLGELTGFLDPTSTDFMKNWILSSILIPSVDVQQLMLISMARLHILKLKLQVLLQPVSKGPPCVEVCNVFKTI